MPVARKTYIARVVTLAAWFALFFLLLAWYLWLAPATVFHPSVVLVVVVGPLLLPLRGLLAGRAYTHAWTTLLILLYFAHGVTEVMASPDARVLAWLEIALSVTLFTSAMFYARWRGKELNLRPPK